MRAFLRLIDTRDHWLGPIMRLLLGVVMFAHGAQKLLGWYGGGGFSGTMGFLTGPMGLPAAVAFLVIVGEFFGGLGLIAGFLTRFCAASIGVIMLGAMALVHLPNGLFLNWSGAQAGEGYEYHLLALAVCAGLVLAGGGRWSVDALLARRLAARTAAGKSHLRAA